ncbi:chemotaxis protein CheW [Paraburkholderia sp. MMS20-SJTR3]|uniref:Chemotaxis protein CheW n=1 Tax=Paraburkholderia sejongensis TaxID=2886946 RepID=A0ABS8JTY5_9BURK|nr:chemotaxis protein CheW [Paraburkholderia sp. MMS20-SJTR3]MCC8393353.1 chemotaxis protein CheW [Paraburkholderia sp. MMS20-SJTR3]
MRDDRVSGFDDCWNRIGVRGDMSCERLSEYVRCLNCPVFEVAAAKLLDQPMPLVDLTWHDPRAAGAASHAALTSHSRDKQDGESFLVFRIGGEWLALPTPIFARIVQTRTVHTLPHRQHRAVLGVVNVQGELLVCLSLAHLLGFEPEAAGARDDRTRLDLPRLLVIARGDEHAVLPVDQVDGVQRFARSTFCAPPATLSHTAAAHTRAVVGWRGVSVGLLDADALFDTLNRSLG